MKNLVHAHPQLNHLGWNYFSEGSYNFVYLSACKQLILKVPKEHHRYTEQPQRAIKVFSEIHPEWAHQTKMFQYMHLQGWIMPYFIGRPANDAEVAKQLIHIYQRTGRIVLDAPSKQNFICTPFDEIICIDVGFAFRIQSNLVHSVSHTSLVQWSSFKNDFNHFFLRPYNMTNFQQTTHIIQALLFLQTHLPHFKDCEFLFDYPHTAKYLAYCYKKNCDLSMHERKNAIDQVIYFSFENIKQRCKNILMQYLQSRCLINQDLNDFQTHPLKFRGQLQLSWSSYFFLHYEITLKHVKMVQVKIQKLCVAQNKNDLMKIFKNSPLHEEVCCFFTCTPTLEDTLSQCQNQIENHPFNRPL